jgi:hypothetical protein
MSTGCHVVPGTLSIHEQAARRTAGKKIKRPPLFIQSLATISPDDSLWQITCSLVAQSETRQPTQLANKRYGEKHMKRHLFMALAMASMLHASAPAKAAIDGDTAAKDTVHATAKAGKDVAHGTTEAAAKTTHATGHAGKETASGIKRGAHGIGHGVKKGATKTADALK